MGENRGAHGEDNRHGADHEGGVAHGGKFEARKLDHELEWDAEEGADEEQPPLAGGELGGLEDGQQAEAREDEPVEDIMADAEPREGDLAEEEAQPQQHPESAQAM